jgi:hypothetical protein
MACGDFNLESQQRKEQLKGLGSTLNASTQPQARPWRRARNKLIPRRDAPTSRELATTLELVRPIR